MDVAALSSSMKQTQLSQQVDLVLARKAMDVTAKNSQALIKMMELSVNPNLGSKLDVKI